MSLDLQTLPHPNVRTAIVAIVGDGSASLLSSLLLTPNT
jgi:hypothetical protein